MYAYVNTYVLFATCASLRLSPPTWLSAQNQPSHKMDKVVRGMKKIEGKLEEIAEHLWTQEEVSANTKVSLQPNVRLVNEPQSLLSLAADNMTPRAVCKLSSPERVALVRQTWVEAQWHALLSICYTSVRGTLPEQSSPGAFKVRVRMDTRDFFLTCAMGRVQKWNLGATAILGEDVEDHSSNGMHEITE